VETNFVQIDLEPLGLDKPTALARLAEAGVGLSGTVHPAKLRAVTHLDLSDEDVERAIELIPGALGIATRTAEPAAR
jgi:threonine aldolase